MLNLAHQVGVSVAPINRATEQLTCDNVQRSGQLIIAVRIRVTKEVIETVVNGVGASVWDVIPVLTNGDAYKQRGLHTVMPTLRGLSVPGITDTPHHGCSDERERVMLRTS